MRKKRRERGRVVLKNPDTFPKITVVGGGLAGTEASCSSRSEAIRCSFGRCAPKSRPPPHTTPYLGELVCSNSLGGDVLHHPRRDSQRRTSPGKISYHRSCRSHPGSRRESPGGGPRGLFRYITEAVEDHPCITRIVEEVTELPSGPAIIAHGTPLPLLPWRRRFVPEQGGF